MIDSQLHLLQAQMGEIFMSLIKWWPLFKQSYKEIAAVALKKDGEQKQDPGDQLKHRNHRNFLGITACERGSSQLLHLEPQEGAK